MTEITKGKLLIVDDEKTNLDVLHHIFKNEYTIYVAKSGEMAVRRALADRPDLILLDIIMPDRSGYEVLKELKESDVTRQIPVIFITGLASAEDEEKCFLMGAVDYVTKPFNHTIVRARVRNHLKSVRQLRAIQELGTIDPLTELPGKRSFEGKMNTEWKRAVRENEPISLLAVDVDRFKNYNDTYGYLQGDVLLQSLTGVFLTALKRTTDFVARTGSDVFHVILPNTDQEGAAKVAEDIRRLAEIADTPNMGGVPAANMTVSIGIATRKPGREDVYMDLLEAADQELAYAKRHGGDCVSGQ